jgi:hypothetical protein
MGFFDLGDIVPETILKSIVNGQGFFACVDKYTPAATNNALSIFNPSGSGKSLLLYSLLTYYSTAGQNLQCRIVNANPGFANALNVANFSLGNLSGAATSSVANVTYATAITNPPVLSAASVAFESTSNISNSPFDLFGPPNILILPSNTGLVLYINNAASGSLSFNAKWIEF